MRYPKWVTALLYPLFLLQVTPGIAQTDLFRRTSIRWMGAACRQEWDSALYYGRNLTALARSTFGEESPHHGLILSIIMGETYLAMKKNDSAIALYHRGIELLKKNSDTNSRTYLTVLSQYTNAMNGDIYDTDSLEKALSITAAKMRISHSYREYQQTWLNLFRKDSAHRKPRIDTTAIQRLRQLVTPPDYVIKAINRQAKYFRKKDWPDSEDEEYLEIAFDIRRGGEHMNQLNNTFLKDTYAGDSLSIFALEDLLAAFSVFKQHLHRLRETYASRIVYNKNFRQNESDLHSEQTAEIERNIKTGVSFLARKLFTPAETLFRKQIATLQYDQIDRPDLMEQSIAGLCISLLFVQKYKEAADSLLSLSHQAFITMRAAFPKEPESEQFERKNSIAVIFDMLYTCLYHIKNPDKDLLAKIVALEMQRENQILISHLDFTNKARKILSRPVDPMRMAKGEEKAMQDYYFQQYFKMFIARRDQSRELYLLPRYKRKLDMDSVEEVHRMFPGPETMLFNNTLLSEILDPDSGSFNPSTPAAAPPATINIEFVRFNFKKAIDEDSIVYAAFLSKPGETGPAFLPLCSETALKHLLQDKKGHWIEENELTQKLYDPAGSGTAKLYRLIWAPLESYLKGIKTINYTPSGLLNNIAVHAIYTGKDHLVNRYSFHRFLRLKEAEKQTSPEPPPTDVSIWGNMDYGEVRHTGTHHKAMSADPFDPLGPKEPGTMRKIFAAHHVRAACYEQQEATKENFKLRAASQKGVLHITTHGFYTRLDRSHAKDSLPAAFLCANADPMLRCGLAFSGVNYYWTHGFPDTGHDDGLLTGDEVAWLDLHNIQLVVLSACETGLGEVTDNEGTLGLQRAFKMAGAKKLLVSLWKVNTEITTELLSLFYTNWWKGMSASEALRAAEHTMEKGSSLPSYYWAGFVLIE